MADLLQTTITTFDNVGNPVVVTLEEISRTSPANLSTAQTIVRNYLNGYENLHNLSTTQHAQNIITALNDADLIVE